ncbi:glycosyltransferase family 4 protein [Actinomycetospora sp. C-140]
MVVYVVSIAATAQNLLKGQLGAMRKRGFRVALVCSPGTGLEAYARSEGAELYAMRMRRGLLGPRDLVSLLRMLVLFCRLRPALVNAATPKAAFVASIAAFLARVPVRIYSLWGLRLEGERPGTARRHLLRVVENMTCRAATLVLCAGPELRQKALEEGLADSEKLVVLDRGSTNGVDLTRFVTSDVHDRAPARESAGLDPQPVTFGFVGRVTADKGLAALVDAFRSLELTTPAQLVIIGPHDPTDPCPERTARLMDQDPRIVEVASVVDPRPYLHALDVLVLPTRREGLPNVLLEAGACGLPVVTTTATGCRDAVLEGESAIVVGVDDEVGLARAMTRLATDPLLRVQMGRCARSFVEESFDSEHVWDKVAELYESEISSSALDRPGRPGDGRAVESLRRTGGSAR